MFTSSSTVSIEKLMNGLASIKVLVGVMLISSISVTAHAEKECWLEAGQMYGVDPVLLMAIAWKESRGHIHSVGPTLRDGNRALGLMQINTIHMPLLQRHGIHREDLFDPCVSKKIGAYVLADCLKKFEASWHSVGCYYGGPRSRAYTAMRNYERDVRRYYQGYLNMIQSNRFFENPQMYQMLPQFGTALKWNNSP